jgi:hypothetical protein
MLVNRKGPWYPMEGYESGEQKETMESGIVKNWWLTERDPCIHLRGTMAPNTERPWNPQQEQHGDEQKNPDQKTNLHPPACNFLC